MRHRAFIFLCVLFALGACSAEPSTDPTTTTAAPTTSTTTPTPDSVRLEYGYAPGDSTVYRVTVEQGIMFHATGDAERFGDDTLPIDADLQAESSGSVAYDVEDGPRGGTLTLRISGDLAETSVAGTVNGEAVDGTAEGGIESELARIRPLDTGVVIDATGQVVDDGRSENAVMGAELAALTGLTDDLLAQPLGPAFPHGRQLTVGDTWETTTKRDGSSGPVMVRSRSEIVGFEDGVFRIRTTTVTDAYAVDFSEEFRSLFQGFAEQEGGEVGEDIQALLPQIEFSIRVAESTAVSDVEFDPVFGTVRSGTRDVGLDVTMVFRAPDQTTGTLSGFRITLALTQSARFDPA